MIVVPKQMKYRWMEIVFIWENMLILVLQEKLQVGLLPQTNLHDGLLPNLKVLREKVLERLIDLGRHTSI